MLTLRRRPYLSHCRRTLNLQTICLGNRNYSYVNYRVRVNINLAVAVNEKLSDGSNKLSNVIIK